MPEAHAFPSIPTKMLLPIDFSPSSQAALEMAADLAKHFQAELVLLNVIPGSVDPRCCMDGSFFAAGEAIEPALVRSLRRPLASILREVETEDTVGGVQFDESVRRLKVQSSVVLSPAHMGCFLCRPSSVAS